MLEKFSFKNLKPKENMTSKAVHELTIPKHIAIIMDGNGRWAKRRGLPRIAGHHEGMKTVKEIVRAADDFGVEALTLYAFSTENWKRPREEVEFLMKLPEQFLTNYLSEMIERNVQVRIIGDVNKLPKHTVKAVTKAIENTCDNDGLILNFALNYGSRHEITTAVKNIVKDVQNGEFPVDSIDEALIGDYLLTNFLPDPDLLIRTSGEIRLSNFMLWQLAYTEFYFTDVFWPDFKREHLEEAIKQFNSRGRRFGGVKG